MMMEGKNVTSFPTSTKDQHRSTTYKKREKKLQRPNTQSYHYYGYEDKLSNMKFATIFSLTSVATVSAFTAPTAFHRKVSLELGANIRGPTEKADELRFGWDGTTPLGGAVEVAKPSRMLEDIRAAGEEIPNECEVFNANLEMSGDDVTFEEVIEVSHLSHLLRVAL